MSDESLQAEVDRLRGELFVLRERLTWAEADRDELRRQRLDAVIARLDEPVSWPGAALARRMRRDGSLRARSPRRSWKP